MVWVTSSPLPNGTSISGRLLKVAGGATPVILWDHITPFSDQILPYMVPRCGKMRGPLSVQNRSLGTPTTYNMGAF